jgi:signal transduction histidine kinase/ligand-binding sensor domain-containing protein
VIARLAAVLAVCFWAAPARAQYRFDHWTADNGLPQNSVRDLLQTRDGYIWVTTFDGLVRFDGVRFTVFNKGNSPGLPGNRFVSLFEDRDGDLWAALETGEVVRRRQGSFTAFTPAERQLGDISNTLIDDGQGNVAVCIWQFTSRAGAPFGDPVLRVYRWSEGRFRPAHDLSRSFMAPPMTDEEATRLTGNQRLIEGEIWTVTDRRMIRWLKDGTFRSYSKETGLPGSSPILIWRKQHPLQAITRDEEGRLWLTDLTTMRSEPFSSHVPDGFQVASGYPDDEGNYWFCRYDGGVFRARRQPVTPYGSDPSLRFGETYPLLEGRDGALWIGTNGTGLFRFEDGAFRHFRGPANAGLLYANSSLYEDRAGQLWINGNWRLAGGRFAPAPWADVLNASPNSIVWTMCEDSDGAYWLGLGRGVWRYKDGMLTQFTTKDGLAGDDTKVIVEDGQGGLWIGSYGGLTHYKDGRFTSWTEKDGLPGSTVRALKLDGDGTLWIGTYDSGLGRFKDGRFTRFTTRDGLFDNGVFQILEDDHGRFWMSCNRGIYRVRKQELNDLADGRATSVTCLAYTKGDGLPSTECNGGRWPAGVRTRDGRLWFPTMLGVAMIDPSIVDSNTQPPPVVLEGMRINNQPAPFDVWMSALQDSKLAIRVEPGQDAFEIEYTALSFINSENLRFKYKLDGADQEWVDAGTRRTAYYSYVPPGEYTFRVIAANADGVWNETGASVRITIVPPFWRTWWFTTLGALAVAGALAGAWRYREVRLRRMRMAQQDFARRLIESQETERKRIAAELHDSLGQNLLIVKNRALINAMTLSDESARTQFNELGAAVSQSIEEVRSIAHGLRPPHLDQLGLRTALVAMIEKVAASSAVTFSHSLDDMDGLFRPDDEILLYRIVQECLNNVLKHSGATAAEINVIVDENRFTLTVGDDGRGFAPDERTTGRPGLGLQGIAERVRILGGVHQVISSPGHGTTIVVTVELADRKSGTGATG